jgi:thiol-disulfide isomerase/thioredoxin
VRKARSLLSPGLVLLLVTGSGHAREDLFKPLAVERFDQPRPADDFALSTPDGGLLRLSDLRGKVVFLNFWATWCPACREEMPGMERLYQEFRHRGFVIAAVNLQESRETVSAFMKQLGLTFPAALDRDGAVSDRYRVRFVPTTYLVSREGDVLGRVVGPRDWASVPARRLVASLLDPDLLASLPSTESREAAAQPDPIREFVAQHWRSPIPPQGGPPTKFSPLEASLDPRSCGTCHPAQYADWKTSLHARSMGPGVMGQLVDLIPSDPATALDCQRCHSPLSEQQETVRRGRNGEIAFVANPVFDRTLRGKGLVCAACHVRGWERFGPPKPDGSLESGVPRDRLPHNGATRTRAFLRSEFCQPCHQFPEDGFALNGTLLENTYEEWKASPYARQGVQCQDCHMPDRRHLWRGIHDAEMVKQGVTVDLKTARKGNRVRATLTITNSGVGHYFPTYLTPKVFVRMDLVDAQGRPVKGSRREAVIGRDAALDLSQELYDTRLTPKASFTMKESWAVDRPGLRLRADVVAEPDHFYTKFFRAAIPQAGRGKAQLQKALRETKRSSFRIFAREVPL